MNAIASAPRQPDVDLAICISDPSIRRTLNLMQRHPKLAAELENVTADAAFLDRADVESTAKQRAAAWGRVERAHAALTKAGRKLLPVLMSKAQAMRIAGSLGHPSKLPGKSYGLSAWECKTGAQLMKVPGSTCSSCYATKNFYRTWDPVKVGHARRLASLRHPRWVDAMVTLITGETWFRWHDSGDLQGLWHLEMIVEVARRTPDTRHWLPTREYEMVRAFRKKGGAIPPNLCVRLSAKMIDDMPRVGTTLKALPTSTVNSVRSRPVQVSTRRGDSIECRAYERGNECGKCRACWEPRVKNVSYLEH